MRLSRRARSLARSRPRSLDRPRFREYRDDFEGQIVAGFFFMQRSTSLRQRLHARRARHAEPQRVLLERQRPVRAEPLAELVTQDNSGSKSDERLCRKPPVTRNTQAIKFSVQRKGQT